MVASWPTAVCLVCSSRIAGHKDQASLVIGIWNICALEHRPQIDVKATGNNILGKRPGALADLQSTAIGPSPSTVGLGRSLAPTHVEEYITTAAQVRDDEAQYLVYQYTILDDQRDAT